MLTATLQHKIDSKTKPIGSLGLLEKIAIQIGQIQHTEAPTLSQPHIIIFAADHGIALQGVSAYPQSVTYQMVYNFLQGGAAINVLAKQSDINLVVVDAGVNYLFDPHPQLLDAKIGMGTQSFLQANAMDEVALNNCFKAGQAIVTTLHQKGCNVLGFGEMGIGNTSAATMLMSALCQLPIADCVGRGTGLTDVQFTHKLSLLNKAKLHHVKVTEPRQALMAFGGFEIAQMVSAMLQAKAHNMLILVDGFISSAAILVAYTLQPSILNNAIFCHLSDEHGHLNLLNHLGVQPLLALGMRLGEGTGCALAYPIIKSALAILNDMASFESAGVSNKV